MVRNLWGQSVAKVDAKGRINIPSKVRRYLRPEDDDTFLVMRHPTEPCVVALPISRWEELVDELYEQLKDRAQLKRILRHLLKGSSEQRLDKQGRLNLTKDLIKFGKLDSEVYIVASKDQLEIWNKQIFDEKYAPSELKEEDQEVIKNIGL